MSDASGSQTGFIQALLMLIVLAGPLPGAEVDYIRDVKPILARHCYRCHGPLKQESGLRVDTVPLMLKGGEQGAAVVALKSNESRLIEAVTGSKGWKMPPEGEPLKAEEIAKLRAWIDEGARAPAEVAADPAKHWSFQLPVRVAVPKVEDAEWNANPIDAFVSVRHAREHLIPRSVASKPTLLRRVHLDLIGLPPTREELRAFQADDAPDAYEKVVDRLLASPQFGERWGRHWLDVWRYSDWYGFQQEVRYSHQHLWRWRDWVVGSLNADRGYDQLILNMLAADELSPFHVEDLPATGFLVRNRNTDSREAWLADAVEHTAKAFLGLTLACARCHDHMTDPIPQVDYYRFRAVFEPHDARIDEFPGAGGVARVFEPHLNTPTYLFVRGNDRDPDQSTPISPGVPAVLGGRWEAPKGVELAILSRIPGLRDAVDEATRRYQVSQVTEAQAEVELARRALTKLNSPEASSPAVPKPADGVNPRDTPVLVEKFDADLQPAVWTVGPGQWRVQDGKLLQEASGGSDAKWIRTVVKHPRNLAIDVRLRILGGVRYRSVGIRFDASETHGHGVYVTANEATPAVAFFSDLGGIRQFLDNLRKPLPLELGREMTLRVEVRDQLVNVFLDGRLIQAFRLTEARRDGFLELHTTDAVIEILDMRLATLNETAVLETSAPCGIPPDAATVEGRDKMRQQAERLLALATQKLTAREAERLAYEATAAAEKFKYLQPPPVENNPEQLERHKVQLITLGKTANQAQRAAAVALAQFELSTADDSLIQAKVCGQDAKDSASAQVVMDAEKKLQQAREKLAAAEQAKQQPESPAYTGFPAVSGGSSGRRLALGRWIASDQNTLTARVAVNHVWHRHFGQPLVATMFDFGLSGRSPSHPELLDWLAVELMQPSQRLRHDATGSRWEANAEHAAPWSLKHLHRLIVTSRVYRSQSAFDAESAKIDPENVALWRMNPRRLEAEVIRDSVLFVSGQLDILQGGPELPVADGLSTPRRSMYFRSNPDQQMEFLKVFDVASPVECYQRNTSVVPQQALTLANSELTLVHARRLARHLAAGQTDVEQFVRAAFEQVLARPPTSAELELSRKFLDRQQKTYEKNAAAIVTLAGDSETAEAPARDPALRARELLVHALFNHSDFVTVR